MLHFLSFLFHEKGIRVILSINNWAAFMAELPKLAVLAVLADKLDLGITIIRLRAEDFKLIQYWFDLAMYLF